VKINDDMKKKLNANTDELASRLLRYDSISMLRVIADRLSFPDYTSPYMRSLSSPYNQLFYLAGLVLANPSRNGQHIDEKSWCEIEQLLETIFSSYIYRFLPDSLQEAGKASQEWFRIREVSMKVFLKYYNESILAHNEQIIERLSCLFGKFNDIIQQKIGLEVEEIIRIIGWIQTKEQSKLDSFYEIGAKAKVEGDILINKWKQEGWNERNARKSIRGTKLEILLEEMRNLEADMLVLDLHEFEQTFGNEVVNSFFSLFMSKLGDKYSFKYMTDTNPAALAPIVKIDDKQAVCLSIRQLYIAAMKHLENVTKNSLKAPSYYRHRGKWVENKTYEIASKYFSKGKIHRNIYELPNSQNEHDILILINDTILIIEVKTSPPKPPPVDPVKAFIRIRDAFSRSDTGIQKAYDQGLSLKDLIEGKDQVDLYDKQGNKVLEIDRSHYKQGFNIICITLDDFGALATDLSLLLEKRANENYPFVTNLYDFETLLWGFEKENRNEVDFLRYLDCRKKLHGKVHTFDELEIAGYFLKYGDFGEFSKADRVSLDISYASIFDKHYFAEHGVEFPYENNQRNGPFQIEIKRIGDKVITGIRGFPDTYEEIDLINDRKNIVEKDGMENIGRNDPCPCGSGKKYKKCCGKTKFGLH
jgi:hypothetical protein